MRYFRYIFHLNFVNILVKVFHISLFFQFCSVHEMIKGKCLEIFILFIKIIFFFSLKTLKYCCLISKVFEIWIRWKKNYSLEFFSTFLYKYIMLCNYLSYLAICLYIHLLIFFPSRFSHFGHSIFLITNAFFKH